MATSNKPVDCHDSEIIDEDALLEVASSSKKGNMPDQISLPMKDFTDMKEQNLRILALLGDLFDGNGKIPKSGKRAKRPRAEVESLLGKDQSDVIHSPPKKKCIDHQDGHYVDRNADLDVDKAVDLLVDGGVTQKCDHDVTEKSDEISLDELIQLQDYADEEDLDPELEEKLAKIFLVMAKGKMTDKKLKEKMEKHKAPKKL